MPSHTILQSIEGSARALKAGVAPPVLRLALIQDGFHPKKASLIIRWAQQLNKRK